MIIQPGANSALCCLVSRYETENAVKADYNYHKLVSPAVHVNCAELDQSAPEFSVRRKLLITYKLKQSFEVHLK